MRIALFQPDIPQNTGNIFRLGACLDIEIDIIEPTGYVFDDKRFKRSAMDYFDHVRFKRHIDWNEFIKWVYKDNYRLILLTTKAKRSYLDFKFEHNDILLFGRESAGVPELVHNSVDKKIKIPMKKKLRSINLSSAVAIVAGEACRQLKLFS